MRLVFFMLLMPVSGSAVPGASEIGRAVSAAPDAAGATVEVEERVTSYTPAGNGAGPLWCYGAPLIVRRGTGGKDDEVFVCTLETGKDVPLLCNTRWELRQREHGAWPVIARPAEFRHREPCPIGLFQDGTVLISVNPSTEPPGTHYGACHPRVLELAPVGKGRDAGPHASEPAWSSGAYFTDHSYRGFATDSGRRELLLLNINAKTSAQFVSFRDARGRWHARGSITFPIRAAYPQVALRDGAAHVLAIGDIVEPVEAWRKLKFEKTGRSWDYVFRRLFYTYTPAVAGTPFRPPVEVASVEATGGSILNLDLHVDSRGRAHILFIEHPWANDVIRKRFFPGRSAVRSLVHAIFEDGAIVRREILARSTDLDSIDPSYARFHVAPHDTLCVIVAGYGSSLGHGGSGGASRAFGNFWAPLEGLAAGTRRLARLPLADPFTRFFTATPRGGSLPSLTVDLFGSTVRPASLAHARIRLPESILRRVTSKPFNK